MTDALITFVPPGADDFVADAEAAFANTKDVFEQVVQYLVESARGMRRPMDAATVDQLLISLKTLWPDFTVPTGELGAETPKTERQRPQLYPFPSPQLFATSPQFASGGLGPALGDLIQNVVSNMESASVSRAAEAQWALRQFALKVDLSFDSHVYDYAQ